MQPVVVRTRSNAASGDASASRMQPDVQLGLLGAMAVNIVMFGSPGAGKGTQAERLARVRSVPKISTGDVLREAVRTETELGRSAKAIMDRGALVSDEIMIGIIRRRLARDDVRPGFVLDGFPPNAPAGRGAGCDDGRPRSDHRARHQGVVG